MKNIIVAQVKKQEKIKRKSQRKTPEYVTCQMCGRKIDVDSCSWQEDDEGSNYCRDCTAERESCGCSD